MANLLTLFGIVFSLNVMPVFAPPTWMAMSWVGFPRSKVDPVILTDIATYVATVDRPVLARLSCSFVRNRWMHEIDRQNIDVVCTWLKDHKGMTAGLVLAHAFSPFPSNYIFTACGLTRMRLWLIGLPFFTGRWVSYLTRTHIAQIGACYLGEEMEIDGAYMGVYFIASQVAFLTLIYGFAKLD